MWGWVEFHGNTAGTVPSVRYFHGNSNASAVIPLEQYYRGVQRYYRGISAAESRNSRSCAVFARPPRTVE